MKKRWGLASVAAVGMLLGTSAYAGQKTSFPVVIGPGAVNGTTTASGSMGTARASGDNVQVIGCRVQGDVVAGGGGATVNSVSCSATDASGRQLSCSSADAKMVAAAQAISSNSFISFTSDNTRLSCQQIVIENFSSNQPVQP